MAQWLKRFRNRFAARTSPAHRAALQPPAVPAHPSGLTGDHIRWAYRLLLDREVNDEQVVADWLRICQSTRDVRTNILASEEYQSRNTTVPLVQASTPVIVEIADGRDGSFRLHIDLFDRMIGLSIVRGHYEPNETAFVQRTLQAGWNVLDIGANIGYFTMLMASLVGDSGHVYAFEPMPLNASDLARSIAENDFVQRVTLTQAAVGDTAGRVQITYFEQRVNSGGVHLVPPGAGIAPAHRAEDVPMVVLDQQALRRPIHFIKIDIEGAEPLALRGARTLLQQDQPIIMSEVHAELLQRIGGSTTADYLALLADLGYRCHLLENGQMGAVVQAADLDPQCVWTVVFVPA